MRNPFKSKTTSAYQATIGFPDSRLITKTADPDLTSRLVYMGYTEEQLQTLKSMAPVVQGILDEVLEQVLDHLLLILRWQPSQNNRRHAND